MSVISRTNLLQKLKSKSYRDGYVAERVRVGIPFQIRALREAHGWTQGKLGEETGMKANVVSRLEDPEYGRLNLGTLLRLASAFDAALLVKFVPFSKLLREFEDVSPRALSSEDFREDLPALEDWASELDAAALVAASSNGNVVPFRRTQEALSGGREIFSIASILTANQPVGGLINAALGGNTR